VSGKNFRPGREISSSDPIDLRGSGATNQQKQDDEPNRFHLEEIIMIRESAFKESLTVSVQLVSNASARLHFTDMSDVRRLGKRGGGAFSRTDAEENLRHADADAAPKKENCQRDEKEIADAKSKKILDAPRERITLSIANLFAKKETYAFSGRGIANSVADFFSEKEKNPRSGRGDSHADPEEEKDLADAFTHRFSASQEEGIAHSGAI
jgi:hypothetical protein